MVWRWSSRVGRFLGFFTWYPPPHQVCKGGLGCLWSLSHAIWQTLYQTKFAGGPGLVEAGHHFGPQVQIWKYLGPMSFWSHGNSQWGGVYKINVVVHVPNSYLRRFDTLPWHLGSKGPKGGPSGVLEPQPCFWQKLYQTKVAGHPQLSGVGHLSRPQIQIWKDQCLVIPTYFTHLTKPHNFNTLFKT